ncbi:MAG: SoxR reducing system RseC family protein [candidate division KSB1 bacterium]|jgi:sigma-E factor negative regulatory protein RseC|nr:SoxR reducing system RseC family protein [candidate division KSB1 bacterium]
MERERGKVVKISRGKAIIQMETCSECQTCGAKHACMSLSDNSARQIEVPVKNRFTQLEEGDHVELSFEPGSRILSAFLVFIVPILFMIAGYYVGFNVTHSEGRSILASFAGLIIAFALIKLLNKFIIKDNSFMPTIVKVL